jgi:hypothetical protein
MGTKAREQKGPAELLPALTMQVQAVEVVEVDDQR